MNKIRENQYGKVCFTGFFNSKALIMVAIGCLLLLAGVFFYLKTTKRYVVSLNFDGQHCVLAGDTFELKWIHSVEKQWWIEAYRLNDKQLLLTDTYFETFGAGTPSTELDITNQLDRLSDQASNQLSDQAKADKNEQYRKHQQSLNTQYQDYVHYRINTQLPYLNWMISSNIQAVVINQDVTLPVYQWVDDYTNIYIVPTYHSLWTLLFEESCHDYLSNPSINRADDAIS